MFAAAHVGAIAGVSKSARPHVEQLLDLLVRIYQLLLHAFQRELFQRSVFFNKLKVAAARMRDGVIADLMATRHRGEPGITPFFDVSRHDIKRPLHTKAIEQRHAHINRTKPSVVKTQADATTLAFRPGKRVGLSGRHKYGHGIAFHRMRGMIRICV